jgi:hypothetical protein
MAFLPMMGSAGSALPRQEAQRANGRPQAGRNYMAAYLRVYPLSRDDGDTDTQEPTVHVSLGDLLPLVALAHRHNYRWLQDFLDDEVAITPDLFEVLRAFQCNRPSA